MANIIIVAILAVCIGAASRYIYKSKKNGVKCIGCPNAGSCGKHGSCAGISEKK